MSLRSWGASYTEEGRFSPIGVAFHWVMAGMIIFQLGLGWLISLMPAGGDKAAAYVIHGSVGIAIFALTFFRIVWRIMIPDPFNAADTQGWKTNVAYAIEHLFYVCFLALPLTGWMMWSAVAPPGDFHVVIHWPVLPFYNLDTGLRWAILDIAEDAHLILVWALMLMIPLHVGAALLHHFWDRNDVLSAMLPEIPDFEREAPTHKQTRKQSPTA